VRSGQRPLTRTRSEGNLFALFDEAPVFMTFLEGPDLRIARVNRRIRERTEATALIGKPARELLRDDPRTLEILERVYATGQPETPSW